MDRQNDNTVYIVGRSHAEFTGITEVLSFDEVSVELSSTDGTLSVEGAGLKIAEFNSERRTLILDGRINGVNYFDDSPKDKKGSLISRLFS